MRVPFSQLEWRGKLVSELNRSELLELVEVLHGMVWDTVDVNENLIRQRMTDARVGGNA